MLLGPNVTKSLKTSFIYEHRQSIGQCITQASRPRSIMCPLPIGLGIELENAFGSKWLINHLSRFGFSISADEVLRYKESDVECTDHVQVQTKDDQFVQWVADNVHRNIVTLTGKGTFRRKGVISITSKPSSIVTTTAIKRLKQRKKSSSVVENRGIELTNYLGCADTGLSMLNLKPILQLKHPLYATKRDKLRSVLACWLVL